MAADNGETIELKDNGCPTECTEDSRYSEKGKKKSNYPSPGSEFDHYSSIFSDSTAESEPEREAPRVDDLQYLDQPYIEYYRRSSEWLARVPLASCNSVPGLWFEAAGGDEPTHRIEKTFEIPDVVAERWNIPRIPEDIYTKFREATGRAEPPPAVALHLNCYRERDIQKLIDDARSSSTLPKEVIRLVCELEKYWPTCECVMVALNDFTPEEKHWYLDTEPVASSKGINIAPFVYEGENLVKVLAHR